jgi:hypothetical protein
MGSIDAILKVASHFTSFIDPEGNENLMAEIIKEEPMRVLQRFHRDNIPRPDGLTVEFYLGYFEFIGMRF